jgi:hypothetical protein
LNPLQKDYGLIMPGEALHRNRTRRLSAIDREWGQALV